MQSSLPYRIPVVADIDLYANRGRFCRSVGDSESEVQVATSPVVRFNFKLRQQKMTQDHIHEISHKFFNE